MPTSAHMTMTLHVFWNHRNPARLTWRLSRGEWSPGKGSLHASLGSGELAPGISGERTLDVAIGLLRAALDDAQQQQSHFHADTDPGLGNHP